MCSAVYGTVHYKEPLKLFDKASQSNIHTADNSYLVGLWLISDLQQPETVLARNIDTFNPAKQMWWVRPLLALKARYRLYPFTGSKTTNKPTSNFIAGWIRG